MFKEFKLSAKDFQNCGWYISWLQLAWKDWTHHDTFGSCQPTLVFFLQDARPHVVVPFPTPGWSLDLFALMMPFLLCLNFFLEGCFSLFFWRWVIGLYHLYPVLRWETSDLPLGFWEGQFFGSGCASAKPYRRSAIRHDHLFACILGMIVGCRNHFEWLDQQRMTHHPLTLHISSFAARCSSTTWQLLFFSTRTASPRCQVKLPPHVFGLFSSSIWKCSEGVTGWFCLLSLFCFLILGWVFAVSFE